MIEAILLFSPQSSLILSTPRATKVKFHWILQTSAWIAALLGFAAIYYNKTLNNKPHFKSWHGIMGFSTVVLISLQSLQGVGVLYYKLPFVSKLKPRQMKQLHAVSGSLVFLVACITLALGFYSNWFTKNAHFTVVYGSLLSCIALAGVVMGQVYTEYGLRKPGRTWKMNNFLSYKIIFHWVIFCNICTYINTYLSCQYKICNWQRMTDKQK